MSEPKRCGRCGTTEGPHAFDGTSWLCVACTKVMADVAAQMADTGEIPMTAAELAAPELRALEPED